MNLVMEIEEQLLTPPKCGKTHIIAIDGRAGAGKTTLAKELTLALSSHHQVGLIHLDDIYAGWDRALGPSLTHSLISILNSAASYRPIMIPIYDWAAGNFNSTKEIAPCELTIIEGVGSAQQVVREVATLTIWIDVDPRIGLQRVLERDGAQIHDQMARWQIDEEEHFRADATRDNVDFVLSTP